MGPETALYTIISAGDTADLIGDLRQRGEVLYPFTEIIPPLVCATIADCDDNVEICEWGAKGERLSGSTVQGRECRGRGARISAGGEVASCRCAVARSGAAAGLPEQA